MSAIALVTTSAGFGLSGESPTHKNFPHEENKVGSRKCSSQVSFRTHFVIFVFIIDSQNRLFTS